MLQIVFVLIGTFVGAGFASGKEIYNFFTLFGTYSFFSIILSSILLFFLVWKCLNIKQNLQYANYRDLVSSFSKKYFFIHEKFFLWIINIFLASTFYTMVIALSSLFHYQFHITSLLTISITIAICFLIFYKKNVQFIYHINSILIPILLVYMLTLCFMHIHFSTLSFSLETSGILYKAIINSILYFSYNSLLLIPIIFNLKLSKQTTNPVKISFLYALIVEILSLGLNMLLLQFSSSIENIDLPVLYIANASGKLFSFIYFFVFLSAIITTMVSSGYSFVENFKEKNFYLKLFLFLIFSFIFSYFSFSSLINFFYPLFGSLGLIQLFLIFSMSSSKKCKKK